MEFLNETNSVTTFMRNSSRNQIGNHFYEEFLKKNSVTTFIRNSFKKILTSPAKMLNWYVLLDILKKYCTSLALPLMGDSVTNIDMLHGFEKLTRFLNKYQKAKFEGKYEKKV